MSGRIWQTNKYEYKSHRRLGRLWVTGEEAVVPNKLIMWTTGSDLRELLIANPSCASWIPFLSTHSFQSFPLLLVPECRILECTSACPFLHAWCPPSALPAWHPPSLCFIPVEFGFSTGVTPLELLLSEWFVEEKRTPLKSFTPVNHYHDPPFRRTSFVARNWLWCCV